MTGAFVIGAEQAKAICYQEINRPDPYWPDRPEFIVVEIEERELSWVVYYSSRQYVETGDIQYAVAGNGPYLISKRTGEFCIAGTASPIASRIQEAEQTLVRRGVL